MDESGDLGWVFNQPYGQGGSSRYFVLAASVGSDNTHRKPGSVIRKLAKFYKWTSQKEKKWIDLGSQVKKTFANLTVEMARESHKLQLLICVIDKEKVPVHVHDHHHLFYSWAASSLLAPSLRTIRHVSICPDELNAGSDSLLEGFITNELWFGMRSSTQIKRIPRNSTLEDGLLFCDYLAGAFQNHYEFGNSEPFNILKDHVYIHRPWS